MDVTKAIRSGVAHILSGNAGNKGAGNKEDDCLAIELEIDTDSGGVRFGVSRAGNANLAYSVADRKSYSAFDRYKLYSRFPTSLIPVRDRL